MPVHGFLSSIADKAQSAINSSPLAAHIPHTTRPTSPDSSAQPSANDTASQGGQKSHALETIQYQLRAFGQQYSSTTPAQKIITLGKGVALDFDSVARDSKAQSKELYTWGQTEAEDLKDVTDRLAYLNFVQGSLAGTLSTKLDSSRSSFKALRDAETSIAPRRAARAALQNQLARFEHEQVKGGDRRITELQDQIKRAEHEDLQQEREIELLKRKAVRESEKAKWDAIREYGEKLVLLSQAATPIISALPSLPPTADSPYTGAQATGAARASLQRALDNYKTGHINLPSHVAGSDLSRSDTLSFGESHASELSNIGVNVTQDTPPTGTPALHAINPSHHSDHSQSPPINPQALNQSPTILPSPTTSPQPPVAPGFVNTTTPTMPTVAETGIPVSAGESGPGPASGSLHDLKSASPPTDLRTDGLLPNASQDLHGQHPQSSSNVTQYESAADEKKRLHGTVPPATGPQPTSNASATPHESAEDEKKRLEREERERLLKGDGTHHGNESKDDELPPYQDM